MKVDYEIVQQRRDDIMMIIQKLGNVTVKQLMNDFNVSEITIRRDLQYWEDRGAIIRYHGGAKIVQHMVNHDNSDFTNERYKHAIAKKAASYIEDGDTVFMNTSSTALLIPQYIMNKRCTIITNNAKMVLVKHSPLISIVLTGGELRYPKEAMVGDFALNNLHKIRANKCFLGCSGMSSTSGITTAIFSETAINETMVRNTLGSIFIVCDYTKIGQTHNYISANVNKLNYLITDINASDEELSKIQDANPKIIIHKVEPLSSVAINQE